MSIFDISPVTDSEAVIQSHQRQCISNSFGKLEGESLKRPPRGFDPGNPHIEDLKRKSYITFRHIKPQSAVAPVFIKEVEKVFATAMPLMRFITSALEIRD